MRSLNFNQDISTAGKQKNILFHPKALKVYGVVPYILGKKLKAQFFGNWLQDSHTEPNFTVIKYQQKQEHIQALTDWLYADTSFKWAITDDVLWDRPSYPPDTIEPSQSFKMEVQQRFGHLVNCPGEAKIWDLVLGGNGDQPKRWDLVLGVENS
jgi:hypothetical protein